MKTIRTLLTITAIAFVALATAVEKPKMNVIPLEANKAVVAFYNNNPAQFEINISDKSGSTVYYNLSKTKIMDYRKVYDFAAVEDGEYVISLKVNDTKIKRNIEIENGEFKINKAEVTFDPFFSYEGNVLKVSYLNFAENAVSLKIYNEGEAIYESELGKDFSLTKGFDLSGLDYGDYYLVLNTKDESFGYNFKK